MKKIVSSVGTEFSLRAVWPRDYAVLEEVKKSFSSPKSPDQNWAPATVVLNGFLGLLPSG
jgi:hypothetical protein